MNQHSNLAIPWESHFLQYFPGIIDEFGDLEIAANRAMLIRAIDYFAGMVHNDRASVDWIPGLSTNADLIAKQALPHYAGVVAAIYGFFADQSGKSRWGDKTPGYVSHIPIILELFPDAKIIHIIRDGRDVALSTLPLSFGPNTVYRAARYWKKLVLRGLDFERKYPANVLRIKFEDVLDSPEPYLRLVCKFIGEEYEPGMLEYHLKGAGKVHTPNLLMHFSAKLPLNKTRKSRWQTEFSSRQSRVFESVAGELLEQLGYSRVLPRARLGKYEKSAYKLADWLLEYRPFTKPLGFFARRRVNRLREKFMDHPAEASQYWVQQN
jgi:hypothetical protein